MLLSSCLLRGHHCPWFKSLDVLSSPTQLHKHSYVCVPVSTWNWNQKCKKWPKPKPNFPKSSNVITKQITISKQQNQTAAEQQHLMVVVVHLPSVAGFILTVTLSPAWTTLSIWTSLDSPTLTYDPRPSLTGLLNTTPSRYSASSDWLMWCGHTNGFSSPSTQSHNHTQPSTAPGHTKLYLTATSLLPNGLMLPC